MKMNLNTAAALLAMLAAGDIIYPRGIASGNRVHTDRAPRGSVEERERIAAAETKRARKAARGARS